MFRLLSILAAAVSVALGSTGIAAMPFTLTQLTDNTTDESASGVQRQIALDDLGRTHIVFIGASPQGYQGVFRAWNPGAWAVHAVAADTTANRSPVLACGSGGVTHVLFSRWNGNFTEVEHVPLFADSAGAWEPAFAGESFESPSLCVGPDGVLHAVCGSYWGTAYGQRTTSGWSPSETIAAGRQASIAVDGLGECHVVYEDVDSTWTSQIWYVHGTRGSWAAPEWLAGGNDLDARNASIAIDASNRVLVAYDQQTTSDHGVELRIRTGGTWSAPEWVGQGIAPA